jgi:hypothetical protein
MQPATRSTPELGLALVTRPVYQAQIVLVAASQNDGKGLLSGLDIKLVGPESVAGLAQSGGRSANEAVGTLKSRTLVSHWETERR